MGVLPSQESGSLLDWIDDVPPNIKSELKNRYDELTALEKQQVQIGTSVPQLYGSLSRFVANPSTVSVETFKRMIDTDETLGAGVDFMNLAMIARFGDFKHPVPEIQKFVRRALNRMEGSWHENLDEMFSAEWSGFSITEPVWEYVHDFDGFPAFVPKKLVTYPPLTLVFAVNRHGEVMPDGIYQYQRFHNTFFSQHLFQSNGDLNGFRPDLFASVGDYPYPIRIAADLTYLTVKIPRDKVIHLRGSTTGKFGSPYGKSHLRRNYKNWVSKDAVLKMLLIALDRKGTPLLVGFAAPNDTVLEGSMHGNHVAATGERADVAMARVFKNIHNSSFIVLPGKEGETYSVKDVQIQGDMNGFKDAIDYYNRAEMRGMLLPPLMLGGDGGGSFALGQQHDKILKGVVDGKNKVYKQGILDQFIGPMIAYNFPRSQWEAHGYGDFELEDFDPEVMEKLATIFSSLTEKGYMSPKDQADLDFVRGKVGAPKADAIKMAGNHAEPVYDDPNAPGFGDPSDPDKVNADPGSKGGTELPKVPNDKGEDPLPPNYRV